MSPFVWRKYLDFAAVADVHAMKRQINAFRGHGEIAVEGHNIKLGRGGIREIEFFAQTQQLIAGGRNPHLRDRDTLTTLDKLCEDRWIDADARDDMKAAYCFLRTVEHRLQMVNDEQTQSSAGGRAPTSSASRGFSALPTATPLPRCWSGISKKCRRHYARLFEKRRRTPKAGAGFSARGRRRQDARPAGASSAFASPLEASSIVRHWLQGRASLAERRGRARPSDRRCCRCCSSISAAPTIRTRRLVLFDHFLANLHGAARLLSLLRQKPELIALIALVLGTAPRLADTLARHPQVMDALVDPSFFGALPDDEELQRRLDAALAQSRYDEDLLERIRMFGLEYMFLIGVRILSGTLTARLAGEAFARLADAVIRAVHRAVSENFAADPWPYARRAKPRCWPWASSAAAR